MNEKKFRVMFGNFILGRIVVTDITVRYSSHLKPEGEYVKTMAEAEKHFISNVPRGAGDMVRSVREVL